MRGSPLGPLAAIMTLMHEDMFGIQTTRSIPCRQTKNKNKAHFLFCVRKIGYYYFVARCVQGVCVLTHSGKIVYFLSRKLLLTLATNANVEGLVKTDRGNTDYHAALSFPFLIFCFVLTNLSSIMI
jgi:hypothetical protein